MTRVKKIVGEQYHYGVLGVFLVIHLMTLAFATTYGDDYYYAGFVRNGPAYFVSENIWHYLHTNGRVLVHLLDEFLIGWSLWPWRIADTAVVGGLLVGVAKLASRSYRADRRERTALYRFCLAAAVGVFAVTDAAVLRQSVYWATGSLNYLFPVAATLWFYYFFRRDYEGYTGGISHAKGMDGNPKKSRSGMLLPVAGFFVCATTEQASAAALLVTLCMIVSCVAVKRVRPRLLYGVTLLTGAAGFATLMLAPGNNERMTYYPDFYALSFTGKIERNFDELLSVVLGPGGIYPIVMLALMLVAVLALKRFSDRTQPVAARGLTLGLAVVTLTALGLYVRGMTVDNALLREGMVWGLVAVPVACVMIGAVWGYFRHGEVDQLYFIWGAVSLQAVMLLSPEYGPRTLLISSVLLMVPVVRLMAEHRSAALFAGIGAVVFLLLPSYLVSFEHTAILFALFAFIAAAGLWFVGSGGSRELAGGLVLALCLAQFASVAEGYHANVGVLAMNAQQTADFRQNGGEELVLYYLPEPQYKYTMPYDDPYHQRMYLRLNGIAEDTTVIYDVPPAE